MSKKIIVTGGNGRFAEELKKINCRYNFIFRDKKQLNILSISSIKKNLKIYKPESVIHLAALSRPMSIHDTKINKSIDLNIIGTANLVKSCSEENIKIIFFSTSYVYPGKKGNYKENDALLPWNNYGWSKLGAESSVQMYKNSLIIRACMTEKPFIHKFAFSNVKSNFIFHEDFAKIFIKLINKKGIINIGGKKRDILDFANKFSDKKVEHINFKNVRNFPKNSSIEIKKLKKILKKDFIKKMIF